MTPFPLRAGIFFALRPPAGLRRPAGVALPGRIVRLLAARVGRFRGRRSCRLSLRRRPCRLCFRASGPSCLRPASGGLSHGFSRIPAPCGFRRALSCPPSFVRMCFLSFTVCRRMTWLPAAFSGDFLFPDFCPAPFVCVGCPLFPAVSGHAWCGFRRALSSPCPFRAGSLSSSRAGTPGS